MDSCEKMEMLTEINKTFGEDLIVKKILELVNF